MGEVWWAKQKQQSEWEQCRQLLRRTTHVLPAHSQCNGHQGSPTSLHRLQWMPLRLLLSLLLTPALKEARNLLLRSRGIDTAYILLLHLPLLHIPALLHLVGCLAYL